eukprot:scaffold347727_cov35-Prasinocladus_malaysianus.AAC.1
MAAASGITSFADGPAGVSTLPDDDNEDTNTLRRLPLSNEYLSTADSPSRADSKVRAHHLSDAIGSLSPLLGSPTQLGATGGTGPRAAPSAAQPSERPADGHPRPV